MPAFDLAQRRNTFIRISYWLVFLFAILARLIPGPRTIDDSYITYRYARNILAGKGFVYNPDERVLGTTTPLYTILLVGIGSLVGGEDAQFPEIAWLINSVIDGFSCILLMKLGERLGSRIAGLGAAMVWAIAPYSVTFAIGGLETSLYVLLLIAAVLVYVNSQYFWAAVFAGLSFITRPDALILIGPLAVDRLLIVFNQALIKKRIPTLSNRKQILLTLGSTFSNLKIEALGFFPPVLTWYLFALIYFGNPLPHSIMAKSLAYNLSPLSAFIRLLQHYATPFLGNLTLGNAWIGFGFIIYLFLCFLGSHKALQVTRRIWPAIVYPWLYMVVFSIANPLIFRWYLTPPLPFYMLFIFLGAYRLLGNLLGWIKSKFQNQMINAVPLSAFSITSLVILMLFIIIIPMTLTLRGWTLHPDHGINRPAPEMAWYELELQYQQAAEFLNRETGSENSERLTLAAGDVGVLGYFTDMHVLDTVGLNSPQSTRYYPLDDDHYVINYAIPTQLILDELPDYIVMFEVYGRNTLLKDPLFQETYKIKKIIPSDVYGSQGLLIFELK